MTILDDKIAIALQQIAQSLTVLAQANTTPPSTFDDAVAWRWRSERGGYLQAVQHLGGLQLDDLLGIDRQKATLDANTQQFLQGLPANNALLWGARGTGKSSLLKALLNTYASIGLRVIEVDAGSLVDLPRIVDPLAQRKERFILFVDDLSFAEGDTGYRTLKAALDGSIAVAPENVLIYATSNRRHLLPEHHSDNLDTRVIKGEAGGELHHGESVEEKISLSERFGVWLAFHAFTQDQYLAVVQHWLQKFDVAFDTDVRQESLAWALRRGNRSGRVAWQFACDYAGRKALGDA